MAFQALEKLMDAIKQNNIKYPATVAEAEKRMHEYKKAALSYKEKIEKDQSLIDFNKEIERKFHDNLVYQQKIAEAEALIAVKEEIARKAQKMLDDAGQGGVWDDEPPAQQAPPEPYVSQAAFEQINMELVRKGKKPRSANVRPQDEEVRKTSLGAVGEKLVRWYLTAIQKEKIIEAIDPMDAEKDFSFANGETAEIKTQSPYYNLHAFAVKANQLKKMSSVDHIYFVETPRYKGILTKEWTYAARQNCVNGSWDLKKADDYECNVYVLHKENQDINTFITKKTVYEKDGTPRDMLLIPIDHLDVAFKITQPKHTILLDRYSTNPIGLHD